MKKTTPKKMTLTRETVGKLTDEQARNVQGGLAAQPEYVPITSDSVNACCC